MGDLFRSWKLAHEAETDTDYISGTVPKGAFLPDGIIDPEQYHSFDVEDYAFYYVKGRGVVAAGEIISELSQTRETGESYKMVRMIVPEKLPVEEAQLREISASRLKEIMGHGFYFASTTKRPYLTEEESLKLIAELKKLYSE